MSLDLLDLYCCHEANVFVFLTVLLRFIQEIEMNMGPGQAKQCQLRAFLTYYINDLFLNQVCKIQARQVDPQQLIWGVYI